MVMQLSNPIDRIQRGGGLVQVNSDGSISITPASGKNTALLAGSLAFSTDLFLLRDAANIAAQRNGVNAQDFRIYNTFTSATNAEWAGFSWSATTNVLTIRTNAGSAGGTVRRLTVQPNIQQIVNTAGAIVDVIAGAGSATNAAGGALNLTGGAGAGTGNGGAVVTAGGAAGVTGVGGAYTVNSGAGGATSGNSGAITIQPGAVVSGAGGAIAITGRAGVASNNVGTTITLTAGASVGSGIGGAIALTAGANSATGAGGAITLTAGNQAGSAGTGGAITLTTGSSNAGNNGTGGDFTVTAGFGNGNGPGGAVSITSGYSRDGAQAGGAITITGGGNGTSSTGTGGALVFTSGAGGATSGASGAVTIASGAVTSGNSGAVVLRTAAAPSGTIGTISFQTNGANTRMSINGNGLVALTSAATAGGTSTLTVTPGAHTTVTAEVIDLSVPAHTMVITGAYATQRFTVFGIPVVSAATSLTVTDAATVAIAGAPTAAGAGPAVLTRSYPLWIQAGTPRFDATTTAPSTSVGVTIVNYYGSSATNFLGNPVAWAPFYQGTTLYKIPLYT